MAVHKDEILNNKATLISYWRYAGFLRMADKCECFGCPTDEIGNRIPQKGIVVRLDGYSTKKARTAAANNGRDPDHIHEMLIVNWEEIVHKTRPATLKERKKLPQFAEFITQKYTDDQLMEIPFEMTESIKKIAHNDYDDFMKVLNTKKEAETAYRVLKENPATSMFFVDSKDDI